MELSVLSKKELPYQLLQPSLKYIKEQFVPVAQTA